MISFVLLKVVSLFHFIIIFFIFFFFFSSRRRHTRSLCDWSSDVCSSDLVYTRKLRKATKSASRYLKAWLFAPPAKAATPATLQSAVLLVAWVSKKLT